MRTGFIKRVLGRHEKVGKQVLLDCLAQLSDERDLLGLIFDHMREGVLVLDNRECLRFANGRAGDLLDFDPAFCVGKEISSFLRHDEFAVSLKSSLRSEEPLDEMDVLTVHGNRPCALRIETTPVSGKKGRFGGVLVFVTDVTEQKRQEAERRETRRLSALASLSASLAHEIRNPLNSMGIHAQLLGRKLKETGDEELLKPVHIIQEEIRKLNDRLTGFLDAARPRQPKFEPVSLH